MFIWFNKNKLNYNKGQLAPVFIVVIVVLIIMALVTVNLSKVSFVKTDSSNSADVGTLAAGSIMANVFNTIAQASADMETAYWEFFASTSALLAIALTYLVLCKVYTSISFAHSSAAEVAAAAGCAGVPVAAAAAAMAAVFEDLGKQLLQNLFVAVVMAAIIGVISYSIASYFHYLLIRDMAEEGRKNAIKTAHYFAFTNSGISSKLKENKPADNTSDAGSETNYREAFTKFLDKEIGENDEYTYSWTDGQGRDHYVRTKVDIAPVDTFKLKTTVLPWEAVVALLGLGTRIMIAFLYTTAAALFTASSVCLGCCNNPWTAAVCCPCWIALCGLGMAALLAGMAANVMVLAQLIVTWQALVIAWAGLLPGPVIHDSSGDSAWAFTLCWIEDVVHNRKVRVDTWQYHQGADLELWKSGYPERDGGSREVHSYSIADFTGMGKIHALSEADLRHDPSVVATDVIGSEPLSNDPQKNCAYAQSEIAAIEKEINESLDMADYYEKQANDLEATIEVLIQNKVPEEDINDILANVEDVRGMAGDLGQHIGDLEAEEDRLKNAYSYCFQ